MRDAVGLFHDLDAMVHLGDGLIDGEDVAREFRIPFLGVLGNEDGAADYPRERIISAGTWRLHALHGNQFDITPFDGEEKWNINMKMMSAFAAFKGASVLLFGHSHRAMLEKVGEVLLCNPGNHYAGSMEGASFCLLDFSATGIAASLYVKDGSEWRISSSLDLHA